MHLSHPISTTALTLFRFYAFAFSHVYDSAQLSYFDGKPATLSASAGALTPGLGVAGVAGVSGTADVSCMADVSGTVGVAVVGVSVMPLVARHKYVLWWFSDFQPFWPKQKKGFKSRHITKFQDSNDQCFFVFAYDILTWSSWVFNDSLLIVFVQDSWLGDLYVKLWLGCLLGESFLFFLDERKSIWKLEIPLEKSVWTRVQCIQEICGAVAVAGGATCRTGRRRLLRFGRFRQLRHGKLQHDFCLTSFCMKFCLMLHVNYGKCSPKDGPDLHARLVCSNGWCSNLDDSS